MYHSQKIWNNITDLNSNIAMQSKLGDFSYYISKHRKPTF